MGRIVAYHYTSHSPNHIVGVQWFAVTVTPAVTALTGFEVEFTLTISCGEDGTGAENEAAEVGCWEEKVWSKDSDLLSWHPAESIGNFRT